MPSPSGWCDEDHRQVYDIVLDIWVPIAGNSPWAFECHLCDPRAGRSAAEVFTCIDPDDPDGFWAVCKSCEKGINDYPPWVLSPWVI